MSMMCAIFLSHFVFAVFWRTLVAFGFVFHHDWFCRLYVLYVLGSVCVIVAKWPQKDVDYGKRQ